MLFVINNFQVVELVGTRFVIFHAVFAVIAGITASSLYWTLRKLGFKSAGLVTAYAVAWLSLLQFFASQAKSAIAFYWYLIPDSKISGTAEGLSVTIALVTIAVLLGMICRHAVARRFIAVVIGLNCFLSTSILGLDAYQGYVARTEQQLSTNQKSGSNPSPGENIYYIVPDGMASLEVMRETFGLDTDQFKTKLQAQGFHVSEQAYSAYNLTFLTLASVFELKYPVDESSDPYRNRGDLYPNIRERPTALARILYENDYRFVVVPPSWGGCPRSNFYTCLTPPEETWLTRMLGDYAVKTSTRNSLFRGQLRAIYYENRETPDTDDSGKTFMHYFGKNSEIWQASKTFTLIHMLMPHTPHRNESCEVINPDDETFTDQGYSSSTKCVFSRLLQIVEKITTQDPAAHIIINADHGNYKLGIANDFASLTPEIIHNRLSVFSSVRSCASAETDGLNNINIVRHVLSCAIPDLNLPRIPNRSYWGFYETSSDFGKVRQVAP